MKETSKSWLYELEKELHPDTLMSDDRNNNKIKRFINNLSTNTKRFRLYFISQLGDSRKQAKGSTLTLLESLIDDQIDNNLCENALRGIALGRKNYLFAGRHEAAQRAAMIYSLFAICKKHDV